MTLPVRTHKCRPLRHFRDVTLTPARITDITLSRMILGKCRRLLLRNFRDVTLTPPRITDITLSRMSLGKCRLLQRDVTLNTCKNHGYNAAAEVSCAGSHVVPRILHSFPTKKVKKVEKGQTFSDRTYPTVFSKPRGRCAQSLVQIGSEMWICIRYKYPTVSSKPRGRCVQSLVQIASEMWICIRYKQTRNHFSIIYKTAYILRLYHFCVPHHPV